MENKQAAREVGRNVGGQLSMTSLAFWNAFWTTMRPYLTFVSGAAGLVGLAFDRGIGPVRAIGAFIPFFFSYGLGQALTDCFQTDTDAISSPYRPLVRGIVSRRQVLAVSLTGLLLGTVILGVLNPMIMIFGIVAVLGLLTYTILKRTWWGGPPWNSWIVALLPIMGRLVDRGYHLQEIFRIRGSSLAFISAVLAVFFGYANFVVIGYFKDISADRSTGYRTFPVVFGWRANAIYSDLLAVAAAALTGATILSVGRLSVYGLLLYVFAIGLNVYAQNEIHRTRDEKKAHGPIAHVVRSFILYCGSIAVTLKPQWIVLMVVFYFAFEWTLKLRPEERQV